MTNAEKYLNKGASARELREKLANWIFSELGYYEGTEDAIDTVIGDFFDTIEKPTLTEDERVILRNIDLKEWQLIGRKDEELYLAYIYGESKSTERDYIIDSMYGKLFQFIEERRRISH